jgi:tryptophanyl-tRNA synthetase
VTGLPQPASDAGENSRKKVQNIVTDSSVDHHSGRRPPANCTVFALMPLSFFRGFI